MVMLPELIAIAVALLATFGEWMHWRRVERIKRLAFGPGETPAIWARSAWLLRVVALTAACWGFASLYFVVEAQVHNKQGIPENEMKHLVLVVDVSPSMLLQDAGPEGLTTRRQRASDLLESLFGRVPMRQFKISLIAVYSDAKPLLKDSRDHEVVRTIIEEMPLLHAFRPGKTKLMEGIKLTAQMVKSWNPNSTHVVILTDGDTVADKGMPQMPASVRDVIVVGLGDNKSGKFIDGHQSRQDTGTLRQIANRLRGTFHDGNKKHLPTKIANRFFDPVGEAGVASWNRREWSIFACVAGSFIFAMLPVMLHYFGTSFVAGTKRSAISTNE